MYRLIAIILIAVPPNLFAKCDTIAMQYKFQIEGADFTHTAAWIGGWSHAIVTSGKENQNICIPECASVVTKAIVDILNEKFSGQTISAETASAAIWPELKKHLRCKSAGLPNKPLQPIARTDRAPAER